MGETREEISEAMADLHEAGCDLLTITQYLRPTERHLPVDRWVKPQEFLELQQEAEELGFLGVMSGPLVRSSYRAGRCGPGQCARRAARSPKRWRTLSPRATPARKQPPWSPTSVTAPRGAL